MKHCRLLAGSSGILGAFFSLYILFVGPEGVNLWFQALITHLLVSGGTFLLMSEKTKATYYAVGAYLISFILIILQLLYIPFSLNNIRSLIFLLFIMASFFAFVFAFASIFDNDYGQNRYKHRW